MRFVLRTSQLAFPGREMQDVVEPGRIQVWVGGNSQATMGTEFEIVDH